MSTALTRFQYNNVLAVQGAQGVPGPPGTPGVIAAPDSVLALRSTAPASGQDFRPRSGQGAPNDGGGGFWVWSPSDTRTDDGLSVIQKTGTATGRWNAIVERYMSLEGVLSAGNVVVDGAITAATNSLACLTSTPFKPSDVGRLVTVLGAGPGGTTLATTIAGYVDAGHVTLTANASTTVFSAQVLWGADNLAAINAAIATATSAAYKRSALLFPRGIFCVSGRISVDTHGLTLQGDCRQRGANNVHDASVLALCATDTSLLTMAGAHHQLRDLWLHGGNVASSRVLDLHYSVTSGIGAFTESLVENCIVSNAAPNTGDLVASVDSLQINKIAFRGCTIRQDPLGTQLNGTTPNRCRYWLNNPNGNAFEISFTDCIFYSAGTAGICLQASLAGPNGGGTLPPAGQFPAGGAYFYSCEFYDYTGPVCIYECCRHTSFVNCYTEAGSYPFFQETNVYPNFTWSEAVTAHNTVMGTGGYTLQLQKKQPFRADSCVIGNPFQVGNAGPYWPELSGCSLVALDYANGILGLPPIDHPERVILRHCPVTVFQTTPVPTMVPVVSYWDHDPSQGWVSPLPYSVYGLARSVADGVTNGTTTITSATLALTQEDVGRQVYIYSESAGIRWAGDSIASVVNPTTCTVTTNRAAATGVILNLGATLVGSEQSALLAAANAALSAGCELRFPPGVYMTASQTFPAGLTMRFQPGAFLLVTGAGASGATVVISGRVISDHNPFLGEFGPTVHISNAFANFLTVSDAVDLRGSNTFDALGDFDQYLPTAGIGAYIRTITDTGVHLTTGRNYFVEQLTNSVFLADNQTAQTVTYKPKNSTSAGTGIAVAAGKKQLLVFDGTNIVAAGAAA